MRFYRESFLRNILIPKNVFYKSFQNNFIQLFICGFYDNRFWLFTCGDDISDVFRSIDFRFSAWLHWLACQMSFGNAVRFSFYEYQTFSEETQILWFCATILILLISCQSFNRQWKCSFDYGSSSKFWRLWSSEGFGSRRRIHRARLSRPRRWLRRGMVQRWRTPSQTRFEAPVVDRIQDRFWRLSVLRFQWNRRSVFSHCQCDSFM